MSKFKDAALIVVVLIVGLIVIGALLTSPTLELIKVFATPLTALIITPLVTKELEIQKRKYTVDRNNQEALKDYLKQMTTLLVDKRISEEPHHSITAQTAKALTLSVLRELDLDRRKQLIEFLLETKLVQYNSENQTPGLLKNSDLSELDLGEVNFTKVDLSGANLNKTNLTGANLNGANLDRAKLNGANLSTANLSTANLSTAELVKANLSRANLSGANLSGTNLCINRKKERLNVDELDLGNVAIPFRQMLKAEFDIDSLSEATYTHSHPYIADTIFPIDFSPEVAGMIKIKYKLEYL